MDASSEDSAPPADSEPDGALADATADASVDASPPDAMMDASFPINLVCERICSFLATCSPMEGGMGEVAECQRGCEMDLVDCSAEQLSALHACGDLMCTSRDDFEAVVRCVTAVECVDMEMMDRPAA